MGDTDKSNGHDRPDSEETSRTEPEQHQTEPAPQDPEDVEVDKSEAEEEQEVDEAVEETFPASDPPAW